MRVVLLIQIALALGGQPAPDASSEELGVRVRLLVVQLGDAELQKRQAAEQALIGLGTEALQHLPDVNSRTPPEVRERLARVRTQLERAAVASIVQGSRVTLSGEMPLAAALEEIQKQTGNRLAGFEGRGGTVKVDWEKCSILGSD